MTPRNSGNGDDEETDDVTPALGVIADYQVQKAFASVLRRIEATREEVMAEIDKVENATSAWVKEFRERTHALGNSINNLKSDQVTHVVEDQGLHRFIQEKMTSFERSLGEIKAHAEKEAGIASGWWKWALGTIVTVAMMVIAAWITLTNKITTIENEQNYTREKIRDVDTGLEKLETKIEGLIDKLSPRGG